LANMRQVESPLLKDIQSLTLGLLPIALGLLFSLFVLTNWWSSIWKKLWEHFLSNKCPLWINRFALSFLRNVLALRKSKSLFIISFLTVIIWALSAMMFVVTAWAFGIGDLIGFFEGIGLLAITMLSMVPPNAPAFVGTYEASCMAGLQLFGLTNFTTGFAFAFTAHWLTWFTQAGLALFFLAKEKISLEEFVQTITAVRVPEQASASSTDKSPPSSGK